MTIERHKTTPERAELDMNAVEPDQERDKVSARRMLDRRSTPIWVTVAIALMSALAAGAVVAAIDRPERATIGAWIADFAKSSGLAGLCALLAAVIAWRGIQRQVAATRSGLAEQRRANESSAWWERFEWVAERVAPTVKGSETLPYPDILHTLVALRTSTTDDAQMRIIGDLTQIASSRHKQAGDNGKSAEEEHDNGRTLEALRHYARATEGTPARSASVEAALYEREVLSALEVAFPSGRITTGMPIRLDESRRYEADALLLINDTEVVIEIKNYKRRTMPLKVMNHLRHMAWQSGRPIIVVSPSALNTDTQPWEPPLFNVTWDSEKNTVGALRQSLEAVVANLDPPRQRI